MRKPASGEVVATYSGQGEITFPLGGRIRSYFKLTEYSTGKRLLTCEGRFTKDSYPSWERLVHQYRIEGNLSLERAAKNGLVERFEGQTEDHRQLTVRTMFMIAAHASTPALTKANLTLQMQFDCQDVSLEPSPAGMAPAGGVNDA